MPEPQPIPGIQIAQRPASEHKEQGTPSDWAMDSSLIGLARMIPTHTPKLRVNLLVQLQTVIKGYALSTVSNHIQAAPPTKVHY